MPSSPKPILRVVLDPQANTRRQYLLDKIVGSARGARSFDTSAAKISIAIASVRFDLMTRDASLERRLTRYFAKYLAPGNPHAEIFVEPIRTGDPELWEDEDAEFHQFGSAVVQRDFTATRVSRSSEFGTERAIAYINGELDDSFHNLLRWYAPRILLAHRCFLLHGAGVVRDGKGYVFFGQSGAGKTTSSSLIHESDPHATRVGDDAVIIQVDSQGEARLHGAPLGCGYSSDAPEPVSAPLAGLYALKQADAHAIEPLSPSQGMAALLASAMNVTAAEDADARFDLAQSFALAAPGIQALHFSRDAGFWPLVLAASLPSHPEHPRRPHVERHSHAKTRRKPRSIRQRRQGPLPQAQHPFRKSHGGRGRMQRNVHQ
jgi:hypothetical protein